jgi:hypothetical protein
MNIRGRRWYRFSLRGLLLAVTLLAVWLGWNVNTIRQRRAAIADWQLRGGGVYSQKDSADDLFGPAPVKHELPLVRRLLGDEAISNVFLPPEATSAELETAAKLFSEAYVKPSARALDPKPEAVADELFRWRGLAE